MKLTIPRKTRLHKTITSVKTYPATDTNSHHNSVVANKTLNCRQRKQQITTSHLYRYKKIVQPHNERSSNQQHRNKNEIDSRNVHDLERYKNNPRYNN